MDLPLSLSVGVQGLPGLVGHVAVQLGRGLKGRVHGEHGHPGVDGVNVSVGHVAGHGAAAALVRLAQFRQLPDHLVLFKNPPDLSHHLRGGVRGPGLAPGPVYLLRQTP